MRILWNNSDLIGVSLLTGMNNAGYKKDLLIRKLKSGIQKKVIDGTSTTILS